MPVPSTTVSFTDIKNEFGGTNPLNLSQYYNTSGKFGFNISGIPINGAISFNNFRGKSKTLIFIASITGTNNTINISYDTLNYKYAYFSTSGTFSINNDITCDIIIIAGGGGGSRNDGMEGGAGGGAGGVGLGTINLKKGVSYNISIGNGGNGAGSLGDGSSGGNTTIIGDVINETAYGGGFGGLYGGSGGGSGGGGSGFQWTNNGGSATRGQSLSGANASITYYGNNGGTGYWQNSGGGGGGGAGGAGNTGNGSGGNGGNGIQSSITGISTYYGGGGGGAGSSGGAGGLGGGGTGGNRSYPTSAVSNTGGGGGGASYSTAGNGGSGVVIIRYKNNSTYPILKDINPILWYKFDDSVSSILNDTIASSNNLTNNGSTYDNINFVKGNGSIKFTASSSQYATIPNNFNWSTINATNGISFSWWARNNNSSGIWARMFDFGNKNSTADGGCRTVMTSRNGGSTDHKFEITNPTEFNYGYTSSYNFVTSGVNYYDGNWRHYAWTISSTGIWNIYINNIKILDNGLRIPIPTMSGNILNYLGKSLYNNDGYYDGNIDDFRIYNFVLSSTQITELFN